MNKEFRIAVISLIVEVLGIIIGLLTNIVSFSVGVLFYIIIFALLSSLILAMITRLIKQIRIKSDLANYVSFIEFLMHNDRHCFVILPKIRMYIHSKKITNDVKIKLLRITYDITKTQNKDLLGDMIINYDFDIDNKNIPERFHFVYGTDYTKSDPEVKFNYGNNYIVPTIQATQENTEKVAVYWLGFLKHYKFGIDKRKISQVGDFKIRIELKCKEAFDFSIPRDTIICLPDMFSKDIDKIEYQINLHGYDKEFYSNAYRILGNGKEYSIDDISDQNGPSTSITQTFYPNTIEGEKAFFFKIGQSKTDPEFK